MSFREDVQSFKVYDDIQHENIRGNGAKILKRYWIVFTFSVMLYNVVKVTELLLYQRHATKTTLKKSIQTSYYSFIKICFACYF